MIVINKLKKSYERETSVVIVSAFTRNTQKIRQNQLICYTLVTDERQNSNTITRKPLEENDCKKSRENCIKL